MALRATASTRLAATGLLLVLWVMLASPASALGHDHGGRPGEPPARTAVLENARTSSPADATEMCADARMRAAHTAGAIAVTAGHGRDCPDHEERADPGACRTLFHCMSVQDGGLIWGSSVVPAAARSDAVSLADILARGIDTDPQPKPPRRAA